MKKLLMIMVITTTVISCTKEKIPASSSSSSSSSAGTEDRIGTPPQVVLNAFVTKFGNVAVREWKLRSDGTWRAHFTKNGVAWETTFKADGTLIKSEPA